MLRLLAVVVALAIAYVAPGQVRIDERLLDAIMQVESGGDPTAVVDGGKAIGAYQIHRGYWQDAVEFDRTLGGVYEDCFDPAYARRVVVAYLTRYAPKNATMETLARIHNGGCNIMKKKGTKPWHNTTAYWKKIQRQLERQRQHPPV